MFYLILFSPFVFLYVICRKEIMKNSVLDTQALVVTSQHEMLEKLQKSESLLDDIQRGLNDYLEKKRLFFPRFFFLSNDELLEILSETKDPLRVQPHLKKCFEGIAQLTFNTDREIIAMESAEKEKVTLCQKIIPAEANGLVEKWLIQVRINPNTSKYHGIPRGIILVPPGVKVFRAKNGPRLYALRSILSQA